MARTALYALDAAIALGASRVTYVAEDADRLRVAQELGAELVEDRRRPHTRPAPMMSAGAGLQL